MSAIRRKDHKFQRKFFHSFSGIGSRISGNEIEDNEVEDDYSAESSCEAIRELIVPAFLNNLKGEMVEVYQRSTFIQRINIEKCV